MDIEVELFFTPLVVCTIFGRVECLCVGSVLLVFLLGLLCQNTILSMLVHSIHSNHCSLAMYTRWRPVLAPLAVVQSRTGSTCFREKMI